MGLFFDFIERGVGTTTGFDSIEGFYEHFKTQYNELCLNSNFRFRNGENKLVVPSFQEFEETMVGYLLPSTIIHQAVIVDGMVKSFFDMYDFIEKNSRGQKFVDEYNKSSNSLTRLCSLLAYAHQRNVDYLNEAKTPLVEKEKANLMGSCIFENTNRSLFLDSPWCKMLLQMNEKKALPEGSLEIEDKENSEWQRRLN